MEQTFASAWRSFWHTMTSKDRHAPHDSPYRTGQHVPISQNRHAPLATIATTAADSTQDLSSPYRDDAKRPSFSSHNATSSPSRPYSPGMRSLSSPKAPKVEEMAAPGEIQMQSFADGSPPPPPVTHSWRKIDAWAETHYTELWDQLGDGCTQNDINELEHELDLSLPQDVRDSLAVHDGQERGGRPTGIIFGCMLLDCEEIVQEWKNWKLVNEEYLNRSQRPAQPPVYPLKGLNQGASSSSSNGPQSQNNKYWRQELFEKQDSQPPRAVQKAYAHPSWISLARDWGGNNIAVDLAPGPTGQWGQVILFGRDYDCKYVIARSWAHFLAAVADDMNSGKTYVDEETAELKLREFKSEAVEPAYMDIMRWRADQKYGRRPPPNRNSKAPGNLNTSVNGVNSKGSPYASPMGGEERGRSPHRFARGPSGSPRHNVGSPLARVQEEVVSPHAVQPSGDVSQTVSLEVSNGTGTASGHASEISTQPALSKQAPNKLIDVPTPISATAEKRELPSTGLSRQLKRSEENKENEDIEKNKQNGLDDSKGLGVGGIEDELKSVAI